MKKSGLRSTVYSLRLTVGAILLLWLMGLHGAVAAPQVQLLTGESPYYTGAPIELQVVADDFDDEPQPSIEVKQPRKGQLKLTGVSPNISSSIQIINGRMTRS